MKKHFTLSHYFKYQSTKTIPTAHLESTVKSTVGIVIWRLKLFQGLLLLSATGLEWETFYRVLEIKINNVFTFFLLFQHPPPTPPKKTKQITKTKSPNKHCNSLAKNDIVHTQSTCSCKCSFVCRRSHSLFKICARQCYLLPTLCYHEELV